MGDQIQLASDTTGLSPVFLIRDFAGQVWQTTTNTFVAYVSANRANYEIAMTEQGTGASRFYSGTFDTDVTNGDFNVEIRESASESGILAGAMTIGWDGTNLIEDKSAFTTASIADAVWDELRAGHIVAGSFGQFVNVNSTGIADSVWDVSRATHTVVGSFGEGVKLAADGLDLISTSDPIGPAANFTERLNWLYARQAHKNEMTSTELKVFNAASTVVITTQALTDDNVTQTLAKVTPFSP